MAGLAQAIKEKAGGKYDNIPDDVLESAFLEKYPQLAHQKAALDMPAPPDPIRDAPERSLLGSELIGAVKGGASAVRDTANMLAPSQDTMPHYSGNLSPVPLPSSDLLEPSEGEQAGYYGAKYAPDILGGAQLLKGGGRLAAKGAGALLKNMTPGRLEFLGTLSPRLRSGVELGQRVMSKLEAARAAQAAVEGSSGIPGVKPTAPPPPLPQIGGGGGAIPTATPGTLTGGVNGGQIKAAIEAAGGIDAGEWGDTGVHMFHDPQTGSTLAMKSGEITPESVADHIKQSREEFAKFKAPDIKIPENERTIPTPPKAHKPADIASYAEALSKRPLVIGGQEVGDNPDLLDALIKSIPPRIKRKGLPLR